MSKPIDQRYKDDPFFYNLVNYIVQMIEGHQTTPTEIRDACMLAQLIVESKSLTFCYFSADAEYYISRHLKGNK